MLDGLRIEPIALVVVFLIVTAIIGGAVFALYRGIHRLIAYLERRET